MQNQVICSSTLPMDSESQDDELVVLSSIFEGYFREAASSRRKGGELVINLDLPETITLITNNGRHGNLDQHIVHHLPPIYLHFSYPSDYPSAAPPNYTLSCKWITRGQLSLICQELDRLWEENKGDVILYTWSQFIKEEAVLLLQLGDTLDVDELRPRKEELARGGASSPTPSDSLGHRTSESAAVGARRNSGNKVPGGTIKASAAGITVEENAIVPDGENDQSNICDSSFGTTSYSSCIVSNIIVDGSSGDKNEGVSNSSKESCSKRTSIGQLDNTQDCDIVTGGGVSRCKFRHQSSSEYDNRTIQDISPKTNLMMVLREYDQDTQRKLFQNKSFECKVCFAEKIGSQCLEFWPCSHVYCKDCMKGYFEVQITEGNVKLLKCPTEKCSSEANPKQVEELVSMELYERWDTLLLSTTLSALGDTQPCPRQHCQYPVTIDDNQGYCPACSFVFCALCRFGEHGVDPCRLKNSEARKVLEEYGSGDAAVRKRLEDRFGKKYLTKLHDELLSMNYLCDNTKKCPKCAANIEKTDGCNKMVCQRCGASFCWLCMSVLDPARPYQHFNGPKSRCFNKLFEGVDPEDEVDDGGGDEELLFLDDDVIFDEAIEYFDF